MDERAACVANSSQCLYARSLRKICQKVAKIFRHMLDYWLDFLNAIYTPTEDNNKTIKVALKDMKHFHQL